MDRVSNNLNSNAVPPVQQEISKIKAVALVALGIGIGMGIASAVFAAAPLYATLLPFVAINLATVGFAVLIVTSLTPQPQPKPQPQPPVTKPIPQDSTPPENKTSGNDNVF